MTNSKRRIFSTNASTNISTFNNKFNINFKLMDLTESLKKDKKIIIYVLIFHKLTTYNQINQHQCRISNKIIYVGAIC